MTNTTNLCAECEAHRYAARILQLSRNNDGYLYNELYEAFLSGFKLGNKLNKNYG